MDAEPECGPFGACEPDGVPHSMLAHGQYLYVVEINHNSILRVDPPDRGHRAALRSLDPLSLAARCLALRPELRYTYAMPTPDRSPDRRAFLSMLGGAALAATARAQDVSLEPTPRDWSGQTPIGYPDPDIVALDNRFRRYVLFNTPLQRLHTGTLWAEGPAWNGVGRYLVWSDIPSNVQHRWIADDGRVTTFRNPSGFSNGNTFDREGRQLSAEHGGRRIVRYEPDGTTTVIADRYNGNRLNSPNDVVVHRDGSIWFTDPIYGIRGNYEGFQAESETKEAVYRVDPSTGAIQMATDEVAQPNGLCFSPDYARLYVADTGAGETKVWDVVDEGTRLANPRQFVPVGNDGIRCDADGNLWGATRPGVRVFAPDRTPIGMIRLPEICANVCFGGTRRNRLFMTASQSLYAVYVGVSGAGIA